MIIPMKKIFLIVQSKDVNASLHKLRELGVLHIEHQNIPSSQTIEKLNEEKEAAGEAISLLPAGVAEKKPVIDPSSLVKEILGLREEKELLVENTQHIKHEIEKWEAWGDFDPDAIEGLGHKGIHVKLCALTTQELQNIPEDAALGKIFKKGNIFYCAIISRKEIALPFETLELPEMGLNEMLLKKVDYEKRLKMIEERLLELSGYKNEIFSYKGHLESIVELNKAREGMAKFEELAYLKGYCPYDRVDVIEKNSRLEKWGLVVEDVDENDIPPTLVKNPKWVEIIKPMFNIIKTIPGYREMDISPHFLVFFSLFFGMLIGDAGYGLVYIILGMIVQKRFKAMKDKSIFFLTYVLSSCAITWGLITGVFFGPHEWLKPLVPYFRDSTNVQAFCFLIGAVQLSLAHIWKILRKWPSLKALSDIGWIAILWSAYFLAKSLILNFEFPGFGKWIFITGACLVILFTNPVKNIFAGIGTGLGDFLLKLVNSFADIVSYIRLFAVGLAGVAIADAFNQIAASIGAGNILSGLLSALVLFSGHTLNLTMGILSILIHGVRLNVLEFSGHLDMEWSGVEYNPFKVKD